MSVQEKKAIVSIFSSILILALYSLFIYNRNQGAILQNPNDFAFWGRSILILIPVSVVGNIIIHIVFAIVLKITTNEDIPMINDEFDKQIELRVIRITMWIFIFGFFLAMGTQAMHMQPYVMFVTMVTSGFLSSLVGEVSKIYYYRKGI